MKKARKQAQVTHKVVYMKATRKSRAGVEYEYYKPMIVGVVPAKKK